MILPGLRVPPTFLVDGFVAGPWKVEEKKNVARVTIEPFRASSKSVRRALSEEGTGLARFMLPDTGDVEIRFAK